MHDPGRIKHRYRQFADAECKGYSELYYELARAVSADDEVVGFISEMPVFQPNLFFAAIQLLTGPDGMPATGAELRAFVDQASWVAVNDYEGRMLCERTGHTLEWVIIILLLTQTVLVAVDLLSAGK